MHCNRPYPSAIFIGAAVLAMIVLSLALALASGVTPTNMWIDLYGTDSTYAGEPLPVGAYVAAFDPQGVQCAEYTVQQAGWYGLMPCYGDDPNTVADEGAVAGDVLRFDVNGFPATPEAVTLNGTPVPAGTAVTWTQFGDRWQVNLHVQATPTPTATPTETPSYDWGDLPDGPYLTLGSHDGPRHVLDAGLLLGSAVDAETDGQPNEMASGDGADEDGVIRLAAPNSPSGGWTDGNATDGDGCKLQVTVSGGPGVAQAWMDFGAGLTPIVLRDVAGDPIPGGVLATGVHTLTCDVPVGAFNGTADRHIYARFRLSSAGGLSQTGAAPDGEVEDYLFSFSPTAVVVRELRTTADNRVFPWLAAALLACAVVGAIVARRCRGTVFTH
ncbi:MAG: hypothetical protein NT169_01450 [Chloroflexi bacterium]|nr:hypothetical protein [Chloroflexota bacterium]